MKKECVSLKVDFDHATTENLLQGFELISLTAWNMACNMEDLTFSFEQQAFPYLHGQGVAKAIATDISLELGFGIRWGADGAPQLFLSRRQVDIESLQLDVAESW